uniref:Uncharacterized protein n=1 Tax=viral metagenome TaxID=1070528 RepID=A0A6H1ZRV9_9ZZZZ
MPTSEAQANLNHARISISGLTLGSVMTALEEVYKLTNYERKLDYGEAVFILGLELAYQQMRVISSKLITLTSAIQEALAVGRSADSEDNTDDRRT